MRIGRKELSRREFLRLGGASLAYLAYESVVLKISVERARELAVFHHIIHVPNLEPQWKNSFIIHLSDLHLSEVGVDFINPLVLAKYTVELNHYLQNIGADPNTTFLIDTGDLVSRHTGNGQPTPIHTLEEGLNQIGNIAVSAKFFIPGNHDLLHPQFSQILRSTQQVGFINLGANGTDNVIFDHPGLPFTLAGPPDFTSHESDWYNAEAGSEFAEELSTRHFEKPLVIASHTSFFDSWERGDLPNSISNALFLHGHTHGGQIGSNSPLQYLAGQYAVFERIKQKSRFYQGIQQVGNGNIVSISPGLGHASSQNPRTVVPGAVIYQLK